MYPGNSGYIFGYFGSILVVDYHKSMNRDERVQVSLKALYSSSTGIELAENLGKLYMELNEIVNEIYRWLVQD